MPETMRQVPYEVLVLARDAKSGKRVSNTLYYADPTAGGYGATLGGSSQASFLTNVINRWVNFVVPVLSINYTLVSFRCRAIMGWRFPTPQTVVVGVTPGLTFTSIATAGTHGLVNGDAVSISGTAGVTGLNNYWVPVTVTSSTTFTIPAVLTGTLSVFGLVQKIEGEQELEYQDNLEVTDTTVGGIAGEAIPLYCAASVRRLNNGVGRNWRSHISLGPLGESQNENGKFAAAAFTAFETGVDALNNSETNDVTNMYPIVVSKTLAFQQQTPFLDSVSWIRYTTDFATRRNLGSVVARKPKLTSTIA